MINNRSFRDKRSLQDERGAALVAVLGVLTIALLLLTALTTAVWVHLRAGNSYRVRTERIQEHTDAVDFAFNAMRNNNTYGRVGDSPRSWTYDGITVTCNPTDSSSGETSGVGRKDRTVTCSTSIITGTLRFFDRGGVANGIQSEVLSWKATP